MVTTKTTYATSLGSSIHATNRMESSQMIPITALLPSHLMLSRFRRVGWCIGSTAAGIDPGAVPPGGRD
jgi:hypothetical protein